MQSLTSMKTYETPCNLIIDNNREITLQSTNYHHYYYPPDSLLENPSTIPTTINPVTINIIDNNNRKVDPDNLLPCLQLSSIMTGSNKISIESLTNNSSDHLKNSPSTITTPIGSNNLITNNNNNNNNTINNIMINRDNNNINNSNMNHNNIHNQTNINHNCINTINSNINNSTNNTYNNHSNYTTTNKLMMKLLPWCKLKRKQFVFRDSLSCDDISSVMFKRSSVQPISGLFNEKTHHLTTITSSPSTSTMATSVTPSSSTSSSHSTLSSSSMTMARLFTGKRNNNNSNSTNSKSNGNLNSILSYTLTNRKRNSQNNSITNGHSGSSISSYPMVSFINKGEGLVTVDSTFDRILMSNENELYSLGTAINNSHHHHPHHSHHPSSTSTSSSISSSYNSFSNGSSSLSSSKSMGNLGTNYGPTCSQINSSLTYSTSDCDLRSVYGSLVTTELPPWFYGPICRDNAITILAPQPIGSFLVRESISKPGCYALSLRVPKRFQTTGVAHYLILRSSQGTFKIKVQTTTV